MTTRSIELLLALSACLVLGCKKKDPTESTDSKSTAPKSTETPADKPAASTGKCADGFTLQP